MKATVETLPALLDALVDEHGDREAVISDRGRLSFRDLGALTERIAAALAARGVGQGTHVGLLLPNWPEWLVLAFARVAMRRRAGAASTRSTDRASCGTR